MWLLPLSLALAACLSTDPTWGPPPEGDPPPVDQKDVEQHDFALVGENLGGANLGGANLGGANLGGANLGGANLGGVNLGGANLGGANLGGTNLGGNNLGGNNLGGSNLGGSNLGGSNLGGSNLGGSNLGGSNLGGSNTAGANVSGNKLSGTNLSATSLAGTVSGYSIHNTGAPTGMLYSGEDKWSTRSAQCIVMGIGSTAFPKLLGQQTANTKISVALGKLPWGFSSSRNGPVSLQAWEAVVWGDKTYCVFIIAAPSGGTWAGVAGFIKAVFRWNAPPTQTMEISGIEASASRDPSLSTAVASYTGMMNAAALFRAGTLRETAFIAGELAFASATTNNQSVQVDFATWVQDKNGNPIVLGNVEPNNIPPYAEALYVAVDNGDGTIDIVLDDAASRTTVMPEGMFDSVADLNMAYQAWKAGVSPKPVPRRCGGALFLNTWYNEPVPAGKCDAGLTWTKGSCAVGSMAWSDLGGTTAPMNEYMQLGEPGGTYKRAFIGSDNKCGAMKKVLSETYVHLWQRAYDLPGSCAPESDPAFCTRLGRTCGSVTATDNCGSVRTIDDCGTCAAPLTCGGAGQVNVCGNPNSVVYEAEAAGNTIAGDAFSTVCEGYIKLLGTPGVASTAAGTCSGGAKVRYVGKSSAHYVRFNDVKASASGTHELTISGVVQGTRPLSISVNNGSAKTVNLTGADWYATVSTTTTVSLNAGTNTIKLFHNSASAPDLDRITVTRLASGTCTPESDAAFCGRMAKNCGAVSGVDNCGRARSVGSCGGCAAPNTCGGGGKANVCGASGSCSFVVTKNVYDRAAWWGTMTIKNMGSSASSNYKVEFDVPAGVNCTNDAVPFGAKLSPLTGTGASARTVSNRCVFTWTNTTPLAGGASRTFNYSTNSQNFSAASNVVASDPYCR